MKGSCWAGLLAAGVATIAIGTGRFASARPVDDGPASQAQSTTQPRAVKPALDKPSLADQFAKLRDEFEEVQARTREEAEKAKSDPERQKIWTDEGQEEFRFVGRMVRLAKTAPRDLGARDALIWAVTRPRRVDIDLHGDLYSRAIELLLLHHADDPEVARVALLFDGNPKRGRDAFLEGIYVRAQNHETKGLVRLALAQYLAGKARAVAKLKKSRVPIDTLKQPRSPSRKINTEKYKKYGYLIRPLSDDQRAYHFQLRFYDPEALRQEAVSLFNEVIKDYGDVPYITTWHRELEAYLHGTTGRLRGIEMPPEFHKKTEVMLAQKQTLAEIATKQLDKLEHLSAGQPAPEIEGADLEGKPLKLSDYRGKVVALVFWGSWCGPCRREVPEIRALIERLKGKPFAVLGVDCDEDKQAGTKAVQELQITWPNWHDGAPGEGPIAKRYHVRSFPTVVVIDAGGVIRMENARGPVLDTVVDQLLDATAALEKTKASR